MIRNKTAKIIFKDTNDKYALLIEDLTHRTYPTATALYDDKSRPKDWNVIDRDGLLYEIVKRPDNIHVRAAFLSVSAYTKTMIAINASSEIEKETVYKFRGDKIIALVTSTKTTLYETCGKIKAAIEKLNSKNYFIIDDHAHEFILTKDEESELVLSALQDI